MSFKTNLGNKGDKATVTRAKRAQLRARFDEFTTFRWGNYDMWDEFGAFLVNEKRGTLQFYNGPAYSNSYTKAQFGTHQMLNGVTLNTKKITITVGLYWFSIEEYRRFINLFNPYEVNDLVFGHASEWRYFVKATGVPDSPRQIVGYEDNEPRYYTEVKLSFEIQGEVCALSNESYELKNTTKISEADNTQTYKLMTPNNFIVSDLSTPMRWNLQLAPEGTADGTGTISLTAYWITETNDSGDIIDTANKKEMFNIRFKNLATLTSEGTTPVINIVYLSETATILWSVGDDLSKLLTLSSNSKGQRLIQSMQVNSFLLPGKLEYSDSDITRIQFTLRYEGFNLVTEGAYTPIIESYARTNII